MNNVPDPTDFPPEMKAPGLRNLDSAFSCQICGEVYDAPMMLNCGHSFCSMCVRRSLRDRHECPSCRSPAEEVQLVKNAQLEDLCDGWRSARNTVLGIIENADSLAKELASRNSGADVRRRKKRRVDSTDTLRPSTDRDSVEVIDISEDDLSAFEVVPSSDAEENETQMQMDRVVNCPLCNKLVVNRNVSDHIDSGCTSLLAKPKNGKTDTRNAWNNILGNDTSNPALQRKGKSQHKMGHNDEGSTAERIPKPSYTVLKDKKLREMLAEYQLPTTGSREQLITRHTQFVLLYNANLDRAEHLRKSASELRRELKRWEDSLDVKKVAVGDTQTYIKSRNTEFRKHVEAARASLAKKTEDANTRSVRQVALEASESNVVTDDAMNNDTTGNPPGVSRRSVALEETIIPDSQSEDGT